MGRGGSGNDVCDEAFVPSADREIHIESLVWTPVPEQFAVLFVPRPVDSFPHNGNLVPEIDFKRTVTIEILPCCQQPHHQVRSLHKVSALVQPAECYRFAGLTVHKVREYTVEGLGLKEEFDYLMQSLECGILAYPASFDRYAERHNAESAASDRNGLRSVSVFGEIGVSPGFVDIVPVGRTLDGVAAFARETGNGMAEFPEKPESLPLDGFQQFIVRKALDDAYRLDRFKILIIAFIVCTRAQH